MIAQMKQHFSSWNECKNQWFCQPNLMHCHHLDWTPVLLLSNRTPSQLYWFQTCDSDLHETQDDDNCEWHDVQQLHPLTPPCHLDRQKSCHCANNEWHSISKMHGTRLARMELEESWVCLHSSSSSACTSDASAMSDKQWCMRHCMHSMCTSCVCGCSVQKMQSLQQWGQES